MKSLKQFIITFFSTRAIGIFIFIFTALSMTFILSSRYYFQSGFIENNISKKDIYANKTVKVVDTDKTQKVKNEIAKKVLPILVPIQDDFIRNNLNKNIEQIALVRDSKDTFFNKRDKLISQLDVDPEDDAKVSEIVYLLGVSRNNYDKIAQVSKNTLFNILEGTVSENDIQNNYDKIFKDNLSKPLNKSDERAVSFLIKTILVPNLVIDQEATEMSQKNALNSVEPVEVTFKVGTKIISAGEPVSKLQKDALKQCGYNIIQLNASGIAGIFILIVIALFACAYYIVKFEPLLKRKSYYALLSFLLILITIMATVLPHYDSSILWLPFSAFTILVAMFFNDRTALVATITAICAISISLQIELIGSIVFIFGAFATIYAIKTLKYRGRIEVTKIGFITGIVYVITMIGAFFLYHDLNEFSIKIQGVRMAILFANGIVSAVVALGLLPLLEAIFNISSLFGLLELANSNHPLLLKLQEKAPGTHHHSQMVAILAEAAAEAIGANTILTKIGALYHDVGKINRPLFFIENQSYYGIENPHEQFSPKFSKMVITTHPKDGVEIAKSYNLPPLIYPFILEHHGDSIASYFYNEAIKQEGAENVTADEYRYNAPKPSSKETAIVMLADSVESAVRSLKNPSYEEIDAKINAIINGKIADNQLVDSPLTFKDLKVIAATFNRILKGMHHQRIQYHEDMENIHDKVVNHGEDDEK